MAINKSDFENTETKMRIFKALRTLLDEKEFDEVTIADICGRAPVSKSTFYRHFSDKYAVVDWYTQRLLAQSVFLIGVTLDWKSGYTLFLRAVKRSGSFFACAVRSSSMRSMRPGSKITSAEDFLERVQRRNAGKPSWLLERQCFYFAATMVDIICDWMERGLDDSPEDIAELVLSMVPDELYRTLEAPDHDALDLGLDILY